jgi:plastocyanin
MRHLLLALMLLPVAVLAADPDYALTIKDHKFSPAELRVPAGKKIKLVIENQDATPEEFESHELNREKVIPGKSKASVFIGPLKAGKYPYIGEFNQKTANGVIIAE